MNLRSFTLSTLLLFSGTAVAKSQEQLNQELVTAISTGTIETVYETMETIYALLKEGANPDTKVGGKTLFENIMMLEFEGKCFLDVKHEQKNFLDSLLSPILTLLLLFEAKIPNYFFDCIDPKERGYPEHIKLEHIKLFASCWNDSEETRKRLSDFYRKRFEFHYKKSENLKITFYKFYAEIIGIFNNSESYE